MKRPRNRLRGMVFFLAALLCIAPGIPAAAGGGLVRLESADWPVFEDDLSGDGLADAVAGSLAYYRRLPEGRQFAFGADTYAARELAAGMEDFLSFLRDKPESAEISDFIRRKGAVYAHQEAGQKVSVLFTGYFEPEIAGSRTRTPRFQYPVYPRPTDLVSVDLGQFPECGGSGELIGRHDGDKVVPYHDRRVIDTTDALSGRAEPIAWVEDPVALFFLHVQGSGKIRLESGEMLNVQYAVTNGLPYRSIGKYLIDNGRISRSEMSMQAIRAYIAANPSEMEEIFHYNPRYVFFRTRPHGAVGCLNVPLTPGRSVALDQKVSPSGALLWMAAQKPVCGPDGAIKGWVDFSRFALNQDTGAAIRGPSRADIFWGSGAYAETAAGYMKHRGQLYYIVIQP